MSNPGTPRPSPRPTLHRKVKNPEVIEIKSDPDSSEVSSTSLDKRDEITNGSSDITHQILNDDVTNTREAAAGDQCEDIADMEETDLLDDFKIPARTLPAYNAPEKIIIVYDSAIDEVSTGFLMNNEKICPTVMLKRSLRFFLYNKQLIDPRHEFALVVIDDNSVVWLKDFTCHIDTIINALDEISACETEDILVLDNLFKLIGTKVKMPEIKENFNVPPPYVVRVLFTYGRSYTMPKLDYQLQEVFSLVSSPYFTFDILMTHEMPSTTNNCIKIFKDLQQIDCKGFAYFFPVGRSAAQLHLCIAKLLGHPLQRSVQRLADYTINAMET
ncbi:BRISC and BRCA1-A complex member 1-like [Atheta coriaria]|uniref:BRISC and BRCA1-A complex member 1-like n=1 Tax=Dalotia coriaria TaxID=877792 RepID=UPI0031F3913D